MDSWAGEFGGGISFMTARGITRHTLQPGDMVGSTVHPAKSGVSAGSLILLIRQGKILR